MWFPDKFLAIAIDGGTTNTRARLVRGDRILATARRSVGARTTVLEASRSPLAAGIRDAVLEAAAAARGERIELVTAAGMLGSEAGLIAVPHVDAPAGIAELARGIVVYREPIGLDQPVVVVPGVKTPPAQGPKGWIEADVMRGEECETLGARLLLDRDRPDREKAAETYVWPGSHTKIVHVNLSGKITSSFTTLAGEFTSAIAKHTLISSSLPIDWPETLDHDSVRLGMEACRHDGLGRAAFLVRIAALQGNLDANQRFAFWLGGVVESDVASVAARIDRTPSKRIWIGGREPLRSLYAERLTEALGSSVSILSDDVADRAAAIGAAAVAWTANRPDQPIAPN